MIIKSKKDLEAKVLEYSPGLKQRVESGDQKAISALERIAEREFNDYKPYISGVSNEIGSVGRGFGYTGDVVFWVSALASLINPAAAAGMAIGYAMKDVHLAAQVPEVIKTGAYAVKRKGRLGALANVGGKVASYLVPGGTFLDRGLKRYASNRMVKNTVKYVNEEIGEESTPWHKLNEYDARGAGYTDVKDRSENIVSPRKLQREPLKMAA
jgi:hypothetical protein